MQRFFGIAQDVSGNVIPSVAVTVNKTGTATLATLYSDNALTPQANPFTSNTDGTYQFYAQNGRYDVVLVKTNYTFTAARTTDILLYDPQLVTAPAAVTVSNSVAETDVYSVTILGGTLGIQGQIRAVLQCRYTNTTGINRTLTLRVYYGGSTVDSSSATVVTGATDQAILVRAYTTALGATNAQTAWLNFNIGGNSNAFGDGAATLAIDSTVNQTFKVTAQFSVADANLTFTCDKGSIEVVQ